MLFLSGDDALRMIEYGPSIIDRLTAACEKAPVKTALQKNLDKEIGRMNSLREMLDSEIDLPDRSKISEEYKTVSDKVSNLTHDIEKFAPSVKLGPEATNARKTAELSRGLLWRLFTGNAYAKDGNHLKSTLTPDEMDTMAFEWQVFAF